MNIGGERIDLAWHGSYHSPANIYFSSRFTTPSCSVKLPSRRSALYWVLVPPGLSEPVANIHPDGHVPMHGVIGVVDAVGAGPHGSHGQQIPSFQLMRTVLTVGQSYPFFRYETVAYRDDPLDVPDTSHEF